MKKSIQIIIFLFLAVALTANSIPDKKIKKVILEYDKSSLEETDLAQLNYFLMVPEWVEKINSPEAKGNKLKIFRRRISRLLKQAAITAASPEQKKYLTALAADVTENRFAASTPLWMEQNQPQVDIIIRPAPGPKSKNLESFILIKHKGFTERAQKYTAILDKMLDNIPKNDGAVIIKQDRIFPILVADIAYCTNPSRFTAIFPDLPMGGSKQKNKIIIFHNLLLSHFEQIIKPVAEKVLGTKRMILADFTAYISSIIMHRLSHFTGPIFLERDSEKPVTVKEELKDYFYPIEEIRADMAAIYNSKILLEENLFSKEEARTIAHTYVVSLLSDLKYNPQSIKNKPSLFIFNSLLKNDAILLDINEKKIKLQIEKFNKTVKKLLIKVTQIQTQGSYAEAAIILEKKKNATPSDELNMVRKKLRKIPVHIKVTGFKEKTTTK